MTYEFNPGELTGALVMELRTRHGLSRAGFSDLAGFTGKSTARLSNIEHKDSWKPGDREAVARVLTQLVGGRFTAEYHDLLVSSEGTSTEPTSTAATVIDVGDEPDDDGDLIADVVRTEPTVVDAPRVLPLQSVTPTPVFVTDDDAYPVSNGEMQTWKRCRRKWWLGWYRGLMLRTEDFTSVRAVGNRVHRALERWYAPEGQVRVDPRDALERVIVDDWTRVSQLASERQLSEEQFNSLAKAFGSTTNLERAMIEGYVQWLADTGADAELRVIAPETALSADLEVDVDGETRLVRAIGLLDVRVHRVTDGRNLFFDHKTVGDLSSPAVTLPMNEQMLHYDLLEWLNTPEGEQRCDGALYNMLRRVKRSGQAKPPFYGRVEVHHNIHELESYKRRMLAVTRDILQAIDALNRGDDPLTVVYPSPRPQCSWDCDFFAVCNLLDDGSRGVDDMINTLYQEHDPRDRYDKMDGRTSE